MAGLARRAQAAAPWRRRRSAWLTWLVSLTHEHEGSILRRRERRGCLFVRRERGKRRRVLAEVLLQRVDAMLVVRMVGQKLRDLRRVGGIEILEQPDETPRVVVACRAD